MKTVVEIHDDGTTKEKYATFLDDGSDSDDRDRREFLGISSTLLLATAGIVAPKKKNPVVVRKTRSAEAKEIVRQQPPIQLTIIGDDIINGFVNMSLKDGDDRGMRR